MAGLPYTHGANMTSDALSPRGFTIVETGLTARQLDAIERALRRTSLEGAGTRRLLHRWCRKLAEVLKSRASVPAHRRVLHFVFAAAQAPYGLHWLHGPDT